ncbi:MAG: NADPH-dependent assimilatory sulfite reductase hemoprotein subunit [Planctomycetota bacterium]
MAKASVEQIKEESNYLHGTLSEELANPTSHFNDDNKQLLKFHGIYQQEDRDTRKERKKLGQEILYFFMVRSKIPGGKLTADQYLVHDELADRFANGSIRLTSRQGIQFHGVLKGNLRNHIRSLNEALVSTLAACGDVERNVMCCPAPIRNDPVRDEMQRFADRIAQHFCPRTTAYHDVWINGEKIDTKIATETEEPIYGKHYLPRKFKTAVGLPEDNCVDLLTNDMGYLVKHKNGAIEGYDIFVGGGQGMTHGNEHTYPRLASPLCFASPEEALDIGTAVVKVQRDFGNREDRKLARLKYLLDKWGVEAFRKKVEEYYGKPLAPYSGAVITGYDDHLGWHDQGDGKLWRGVHIVSGRIRDTENFKLRTCVRELVQKYRPAVRITGQQNILFCDIDPKHRVEIDKHLADHGVIPPDQLPILIRNALACPAIPTCGLALADSERAMPDISGAIHAELARLALDKEAIVLRMTGCPNACVRSYNCDIGIVGRSPGKYTLFLGGNILGDTLSFQYKDLVPQAEIPSVLRGPLLYFKSARKDGEGFGAFCTRVGRDALLEHSEQAVTAR